jgi:hypothetical protein
MIEDENFYRTESLDIHLNPDRAAGEPPTRRSIVARER